MSTEIVNAAGKTVATKFFGGPVRGLCIEVLLPRNLMKDVGGMIVGEAHSSVTMTLAGYIAEVEKRGGTAIYREPGIHGASSKIDIFNRHHG
jgi:hypothetical protein